MSETIHRGSFQLHVIGTVRSLLKQRDECPHQGWEGAPEAWLEMAPAFCEGLDGVVPGSELIVLTWFHLADREVLKVHPRADFVRPLRGVFATRSPDRPNPIGLHRVKVIEIQDGCRLRVSPLEALDGTPVIDLKPVLTASADM